MDLVAPRILGIGTHHKTGTMWMRAVFRQLAEAIGVVLRQVHPATPPGLVPERDRAMLVQWSSAFPDWLRTRPDARILHLVRDPRDVLLSGMRYHRDTEAAEEGFLHAARADLGGFSYQAHLRALPDDAARLRFEMGERHAETVAEMLAWTPRVNTIEARYEDLVAPDGAGIFREHLRNLGLPEIEVAQGVRAFRDHSLRDGLARPEDRRARVRSHVADGAARQWETRFPPDIARDYAARHGAALVALGYETHPTRWVERLDHAA
ncbi:sulfotransferase domain-containing protein [uncultured Jannaschia sp.]|uniref:sulfotransferase domain-containing protein n=1 Tax=uncultured Jannaschia sp. TaxID=293347 RepID=UPI002631D6FA|nr:sulfotransferase domain-containing protein [uncultured Jannaschia sp.]